MIGLTSDKLLTHDFSSRILQTDSIIFLMDRRLRKDRLCLGEWNPHTLIYIPENLTGGIMQAPAVERWGEYEGKYTVNILYDVFSHNMK